MRAANLGLKFLLELAAFASLAVAGAGLGRGWSAVVLAVALPVAAIAVWSRWNAPRSAHRLPLRPRIAAETGVFAVAAVLLAVAGHPLWATVFAILVVVNAVLLTAFGQWEN